MLLSEKTFRQTHRMLVNRTVYLRYMRQWAGIVREVARIECLDAGVLLTIEWGNDGTGLPRLAAEIEWHVGIVKPQTKMILVSRREGRCGSTGGNREGLDVENALHRNAARTTGIRL